MKPLKEMVTPEIGGALAVGAALGAWAMRRYMESPFHDQGSSVFATPDMESLEAVLAVCAANGLTPEHEMNDEATVRALMSDGQTIFNVTREDAWEDMGRPPASPMLRVPEPAVAAQTAKAIFVSRGFRDTTITEPEAKALKGKMYFVHTSALACGQIGFRKHATKMGPKPSRWNPLKSLHFPGRR